MLRENYIFFWWRVASKVRRKVRWNEWWRQLQLGRQLTIKNEWRNRQTDEQTQKGRASNKYSLGHHPPIFSVQPTYFITEKKLTHTYIHTHIHDMQCTSLCVSFFYAFTHTRMRGGCPICLHPHPHFLHTHCVDHTPRHQQGHILPIFHNKAGIYVFWFGTVGALPRTVRHEHEYQKAREDQCWQDHTLSTFPLMPLILTLYSYLSLSFLLSFCLSSILSVRLSFLLFFFVMIFLYVHPHSEGSKLLDCTVGDGAQL